jgi:hypothetical protein
MSFPVRQNDLVGRAVTVGRGSARAAIPGPSLMAGRSAAVDRSKAVGRGSVRAAILSENSQHRSIQDWP